MWSILVLALCLLAGVSGQGWNQLGLDQTIMGSVSCTSDGLTVYVAGGNNGGTLSVASALKSTDGGNTWSALNIANNSMVFLGSAFSSATSGVMSGLAVLQTANQYTADGENFSASHYPRSSIYLQNTQSVCSVTGEESMYGVVGHAGEDGVSFTSDGGKTFFVFPTNSVTLPRYGSFPSATTWFIASGEWPGVNQSSAADNLLQTHMRLTANIEIPLTGDDDAQYDDSDIGKVRLFRSPKPAVWPVNEYAAELRKTTDGGKTFQQQFISDVFYFNEVSCPSLSVCYAVGENDYYAYLYKSSNGGEDWTLIQQWYGVSVLPVHALSEDELWIGGAQPITNNFIGISFHSVDGGNSFTNYTINGVYFNHFAFANSNLGFATAFDSDGSSSVWKFTA